MQILGLFTTENIKIQALQLIIDIIYEELRKIRLEKQERDVESNGVPALNVRYQYLQLRLKINEYKLNKLK